MRAAHPAIALLAKASPSAAFIDCAQTTSLLTAGVIVKFGVAVELLVGVWVPVGVFVGVTVGVTLPLCAFVLVGVAVGVLV